MAHKRNPGHSGSPERADGKRLELGAGKALARVKEIKGRRVRPDGAIVRERSHRHLKGRRSR